MKILRFLLCAIVSAALLSAAEPVYLWRHVAKPDAIGSLGLLTPAANRIPYYTGASTAGLITVGGNLSLTGGTLNLSTTPNLGAATGTSLVLSGNATAGGFVSSTTATGLTLNGLNASVEMGAVGTTNAPYIDLHSSASSTDYDVRLIASGGTASNGQGNLTITANTTAVGNLSAAGNITVSGTQASTSTTTGSGVFGGGVGVAGNATIGGNLTLTNSASIGGNLAVTNNATIGGNLAITGTALSLPITSDVRSVSATTGTMRFHQQGDGSTVVLQAGSTALYNANITVNGGTAAVNPGSITLNPMQTGSVVINGPTRLAATSAGFIEGVELSADPAAPSADSGRLYFRDNGSGKTQLVVRFPTGAVQVLATQP